MKILLNNSKIGLDFNLTTSPHRYSAAYS